MIGDGTADGIRAYEVQADRFVAEYEVVDPAPYRDTFQSMLPPGAGRLALDVGAGSGRDAAWLEELGSDVVAVEPAAGMRDAGRRLRAGSSIRWLDDRLPGLHATHALGLSFDLILLSAVWQHVALTDCPRAFRKLSSLLKPGGLLVLTLRHGPAPPDRPMHEVSVGEIEALAREHGLGVSSRIEGVGDTLRRPGVSWTTMCLTLPDDGSGGLALLGGIILNDDKAATYKLGLLRAVAKVADLTPNFARQHPTDDSVELPLGVVALNWVRMYLPLVSCGLPQMPRNSGPDGLGFAKDGFRAVITSGLAPADLRVGAAFTGERALAVTAAISEAARTIATMPANFMRYPNSSAQVFGATVTRTPKAPRLALDPQSLAEFGSLSVPGHVWRAMQRLGAWIDPVLTAEWARLMRGYAERQGSPVPPGQAEAALAWTEPTRDVRLTREVALGFIGAGRRLRCVWSDRLITAATLDIDHCLPWSAWPCSDLSNLLPAHRTTNQREKRDLLPSAATLTAARSGIVDWWTNAWESQPALAARYRREASATLPITADASSEAIFDGLAWRRLRLRQDQQVVEWTASRSSA